jgi:hypothetical protein
VPELIQYLYTICRVYIKEQIFCSDPGPNPNRKCQNWVSKVVLPSPASRLSCAELCSMPPMSTNGCSERLFKWQPTCPAPFLPHAVLPLPHDSSKLLPWPSFPSSAPCSHGWPAASPACSWRSAGHGSSTAPLLPNVDSLSNSLALPFSPSVPSLQAELSLSMAPTSIPAIAASLLFTSRKKKTPGANDKWAQGEL